MKPICLKRTLKKDQVYKIAHKLKRMAEQFSKIEESLEKDKTKKVKSLIQLYELQGKVFFRYQITKPKSFEIVMN